MKFTQNVRLAMVAATAMLVVVGPVTGQTKTSTIDLANLPAQPVGAEDLISIQVYDSPELTRSARVAADGTIRIPMLKRPIQVKGMLPQDIESAVSDEIKKEQLLVEPFVTVSVMEYHSRPVSVSGAVKSPVVFQIVGTVNLLEAIARAGGMAPEAGGDIIVTKPNADSAAQTVRHVPVRALIEGTDPTLNIKLTGGEEVRVPVAGTVVVSGNVRESGVFPVQESGQTTVLTAIAQAKGVGEFQPKMVYIFRPDDKGVRHEIVVDFKKLKERKTEDVAMFPKDLLYVPDNNRAKITAQTVQALLGMSTQITTGVIVYKR